MHIFLSFWDVHGSCFTRPGIWSRPVCEDDLLKWESLVIGPALSPYAFGFFTFRMQVCAQPIANICCGTHPSGLTPGCVFAMASREQFPEDYPSSAPHIVFLTTNGGKTRFNPNLYSDGKVCLSILGTWRGESGEQWSSVQNCQVLSLPSPMCSHAEMNTHGPASHLRNDEKSVFSAPLSSRAPLSASVCAGLRLHMCACSLISIPS